MLLLMLAFVARRALVSGLLMFLATGLLPAAALVSGVTMAFLMLSRRSPFLSRDRKAWVVLLVAGASCLAGGLLALSSAGESGPTFTLSEARNIPFFNPGGRRPFWGATWVSTYLCNQRAGIVPLCEHGSDLRLIAWTVFVVAVLGVSIQVVASGRAARWMAGKGLPELHPQLAAIWITFIASGTLLFGVAHAVAFKLHLPQRFAQYTITLGFGLIVAISAAVLLLRLLDASRSHRRTRHGFAAGLLVATACGLLFVSTRTLARSGTKVRSKAPNIETYLRSTPKDTLVAGIVLEIDSVPAFGSRSVLGSLELLVPYKRHYYAEMERRMTTLAKALYAPDRAAFAALTAQYGIDYVLVERVQDEEPGKLAELAVTFPAVEPAVRFLESGQPPFFRARLDACVRADDGQLVLADATCVVQMP